jgi:hypothetical protein
MVRRVESPSPATIPTTVVPTVVHTVPIVVPTSKSVPVVMIPSKPRPVVSTVPVLPIPAVPTVPVESPVPPESQLPIPFEFERILRYDRQHNALICLLCESLIGQNGLNRHLSSHHMEKEVKKETDSRGTRGSVSTHVSLPSNRELHHGTPYHNRLTTRIPLQDWP